MNEKGAGAGTARPVRSIGFVGLGPLGCPMATQLAQAGFRLRLYDPDPDARARAAAVGGHVAVADDAAAVAEGADVVVTMLPSGIDVRDAVLGGGIADRLGIGGILIDVSSSSPWLTRRLADDVYDAGVVMVDAAVSGAPDGAEAGTLTFMVGGDAAAVARVRPVLDAMGGHVCHVGGIGAGHAANAVCTLMTAMHELVTVEALSIGVKYGIDPRALAEAIGTATGTERRSANRFEQGILAHGLDRADVLERVAREVSIALELAHGLALDLPITEAGVDSLRQALEAFGPGADAKALGRWVESCTGVSVATAVN